MSLPRSLWQQPFRAGMQRPERHESTFLPDRFSANVSNSTFSKCFQFGNPPIPFILQSNSIPCPSPPTPDLVLLPDPYCFSKFLLPNPSFKHMQFLNVTNSSHYRGFSNETPVLGVGPLVSQFGGYKSDAAGDCPAFYPPPSVSDFKKGRRKPEVILERRALTHEKINNPVDSNNATALCVVKKRFLVRRLMVVYQGYDMQ